MTMMIPQSAPLGYSAFPKEGERKERAGVPIHLNDDLETSKARFIVKQYRVHDCIGTSDLKRWIIIITTTILVLWMDMRR